MTNFNRFIAERIDKAPGSVECPAEKGGAHFYKFESEKNIHLRMISGKNE